MSIQKDNYYIWSHSFPSTLNECFKNKSTRCKFGWGRRVLNEIRIHIFDKLFTTKRPLYCVVLRCMMRLMSSSDFILIFCPPAGKSTKSHVGYTSKTLSVFASALFYPSASHILTIVPTIVRTFESPSSVSIVYVAL